MPKVSFTFHFFSALLLSLFSSPSPSFFLTLFVILCRPRVQFIGLKILTPNLVPLQRQLDCKRKVSALLLCLNNKPENWKKQKLLEYANSSNSPWSAHKVPQLNKLNPNLTNCSKLLEQPVNNLRVLSSFSCIVWGNSKTFNQHMCSWKLEVVYWKEHSENICLMHKSSKYKISLIPYIFNLYKKYL